MMYAKFQSNPSSGFGEEDSFKAILSVVLKENLTMTMTYDDGRQVMAIAHMTL